jgi:GNAT superfamily N-acetyltransferase
MDTVSAATDNLGMQDELPDAVKSNWRSAAPRELGLRPAGPDDIVGMATALSQGEGYTLTDEERARDFNVEAQIPGLAAFGEGGARRGLVATGARGMAGFLLYILRDRRTDTYPQGDLLARLPATVFPADGRFLQIYDLWVAPAWRKQGVATALKDAAEAAAKAEGVGLLLTYTEATHASVLGMNARLGYRAIYRGPMWDAVERVALIKRLGEQPYFMRGRGGEDD